MTATRFWMIRHAIVEENARAMLYGAMDVALCPEAQPGGAGRHIYGACRPAAAAERAGW